MKRKKMIGCRSTCFWKMVSKQKENTNQRTNSIVHVQMWQKRIYDQDTQVMSHNPSNDKYRIRLQQSSQRYNNKQGHKKYICIRSSFAFGNGNNSIVHWALNILLLALLTIQLNPKHNSCYMITCVEFIKQLSNRKHGHKDSHINLVTKTHTKKKKSLLVQQDEMKRCLNFNAQFFVINRRCNNVQLKYFKYCTHLWIFFAWCVFAIYVIVVATKLRAFLFYLMTFLVCSIVKMILRDQLQGYTNNLCYIHLFASGFSFSNNNSGWYINS